MTKVKVVTVRDEDVTTAIVNAHIDISDSSTFKWWCADMAQAYGITDLICWQEPVNTDLYETAELSCAMGGRRCDTVVHFRTLDLTDKPNGDKI